MTRIEKLEMQGFKSFAKKTLITFPSNFSVIAGPNGSGKCLVGSSKVILDNGKMISIKELVDKSIEVSDELEKIDDGVLSKKNSKKIKILTLNPKTMKIEPRLVSAFIRRKSPLNLLRILTRSGREIVVTETHPFFIMNCGSFVSKPAKDIRIKDKIAVPRNLSISPEKKTINLDFDLADSIYIPFSEEIKDKVRKVVKRYGKSQKEFCESIGISYYALKGIFDGQSVNAYNLIKILKEGGYQDKNILEVLSKVKGNRGSKLIDLPQIMNENLARFLGYLLSEGSSSASSNQVRIVNSDSNVLFDFSSLSNSLFNLDASERSYKPNSKDSIIYSKPLQTYLEKTFGFNIGSRAQEKFVPDIIFESSDSVVVNFLAGLFDGDAYLRFKKGEKTSCYLEFCSASKELASGVLTLLLRLGIIGILDEKRKFASNAKEKIKREYYSLYVYGQRQVRRLVMLIPFSNENKKKVVREILSSRIKNSTNLDLIPSVNYLIRSVVKKSGINLKKARKICPKLEAYCYDMCECSREGIMEVLNVIRQLGILDRESLTLLKYLENLANSDIFWDEIVEIKKIDSKEEWVYDLSVDQTHNFIADNFIVHNSNILDALCFVLGRTSA